MAQTGGARLQKITGQDSENRVRERGLEAKDQRLK